MKIKTGLLKITNSASLKSGALLLVFAFTAFALPPNEFAAFAKTAASANNTEDENFDKKFREGRDLIDKQEWKKASEKFSEVINQYPDNKSVDAALYWLAFCYKKQREFEKMGAAVDRLIKTYPTSSWVSDAQVLLVEAATPANGLMATVAVDESGKTYPAFSPARVTGRVLKPNPDYTAYLQSASTLLQATATESKIQLDREDEIKIAAFRSLLSADFKRGVEAVNNLLENDSKASEPLKIEALRSLRSPRYLAVYPSTEYFTSLSSANKIIGKDSSLLREILSKSFRENSNPKIRREIIYTFASLKDEASIAKLADIYQSENDVEVKKAIISSFASSNFAYGNFSVANISKTALPSDLTALAELNSAESATRTVLTDKLLEIIRTEKNPELRLFALNSAQRFGGLNKKEGIADSLSQFYDSATDENFKKSLIVSLVKLNQPQATKKLLEIAKNDKSDALKLEAIRALGQSKDPEAIRYLEEIIK